MKPYLLFLTLIVPVLNTWAQPLDIETALLKKTISVKATVNDKSINGYAQSAHSGDCIELYIKNMSQNYCEIQLLPGQFFNPTDTTMQRMLCTSKKLFKLQAGQETSILLTAFCSQAGKRSPSIDITYKIKKKATDKLLQLAQYLNEKNYKSAQAQQAVWILSDNQPVNLLQYNDAEAKDLYEYLTQKLGIKPLPVQETKNSLMADWVRTVDVTLEYELERTCKMRVIIVNEKEELLKVIVDDETQKAGTYKYSSTIVTTVPGNDTSTKYCIVRYYRNDQLMNESRYKLKRLD